MHAASSDRLFLSVTVDGLAVAIGLATSRRQWYVHVYTNFWYVI